MKKVIFISALAIAAAVSCTKSDIVDTKFNEAISFETYLGRDAQTKGSIIENSNFTKAKVFGYYQGADKWNYTGELTDATLSTVTANVYDANTLTGTTSEGGVKTWAADVTRYWANDSDFYSFIAYAPETLTATPSSDPVISYEVVETIGNHVDIIYANDLNRQKGDGSVDLTFHHALARLTVKATAQESPYTYHIKNITLSGDFNKTGSLRLATGEWTCPETRVAANYVFESNPAEVDVENPGAFALAETPEGATEDVVTDFATDNEGQGYMMMIPTDFSCTNNPATLTVVYSTYDPVAKLESRDYTRTFNVATKFDAGFAYALQFNFANTTSEITFDVTCEAWKVGEVTMTEN